MFTLYCTNDLAHSSYANAELQALTGETNAQLPGSWPRERMRAAQSCSLELLAGSVDMAMTWVDSDSRR